ncbi:hypothetical protein IMCC3135_07635 [Granulosicoccus antarcticus IMCC3135]|uniref:Uncharacterized protein n=1 Tax=Granulosicoccus antarcticus IMCC3135 TaxID=1192854 RepID=A0A2Z2NJR2_9GAMM|nr:hypothetical protein IMCC3135_07635 [Granulosicoccus antarcticus IMCC3135]
MLFKVAYKLCQGLQLRCCRGCDRVNLPETGEKSNKCGVITEKRTTIFIPKLLILFYRGFINISDSIPLACSLTIASWKRKKFNQHLMNRLFDKLGLCLKDEKVSQAYIDMENYAAIAA